MVISNEIQGLAERFGIKKTDDPNAVIVPLMISSVLYLSGDKDTEKDDIKPEDIVTVEQQEEIMELYNEVEGGTMKEKVKKLEDKYILLSGLDTYRCNKEHHKHLYDYLNMVHNK